MLKRTLCKLVIPTLLIGVLSACSSDSSDTVDENGSDGADDITDTETPTTPDATPDATPDEPNPDPDPAPQPTPEPSPDPEQSASYRLTFTATWSVDSHPESFPSNPHFSGLIGSVHNEQVIFWESGQIASDGIEVVAEAGSKSPFRNELNAAIDDGRALALIDAGGVSLSPGSVETEFTVTRDYPEVTVVSMLAPSPDWFVGVHNLRMLDNNGQFVEQQIIDLRLYDSGTDSGDSYTSANSDTAPREPISLLSSIDNDLPFADGLPIVGQFVFEKIE